MANIKFSDFTAFGSNPVDASSGLVAYKGTDNIQFTPAELAPLTGLYAADGTLAGARTITFSGNNLTLDATGSGKLLYTDGNQAAGYVLKSDANGLASWAAETDTNTNIANANLVADAARTLTMGAYNLTIASTTAGQEVKFGQNVRVDGQGYTLQNDQNGITIDWDTGNVQYITLASGSQTFTPSNAESGATYILQLRQPGSGAAGTINWNNLVNWPGGTDPTLTATNGAFDVITLMYNGTLSKYFGTVVLDLK